MTLETKREERIQVILSKLADRDQRYIDDSSDLLTWGWYGPDVFSQFGLGLDGWVFRQQVASVRATVKVKESGTPLVAFITSATTTGCIRQAYNLLWEGKLRWQRDKYPWI